MNTLQYILLVLFFFGQLSFITEPHADELRDAILKDSHITEMDYDQRSEIYGDGDDTVVLIEDTMGFWFLFDSKGKQIVECAEQAAECNRRVRQARKIPDPIPHEEAEALG